MACHDGDVFSVGDVADESTTGQARYGCLVLYNSSRACISAFASGGDIKAFLLPFNCFLEVPRLGVRGGQGFTPCGLLSASQFERPCSIGDGLKTFTQLVMRAGRANPGDVFVRVGNLGLMADGHAEIIVAVCQRTV